MSNPAPGYSDGGRGHKYQEVPQQNVASDRFDNSDDQYELQSLDDLDYEHEAEDEAEYETQNEEQAKRKGSNMVMAFFNIANSILGAGIIGQPLAFKYCGVVGSIVVLLLLSVLVDWTMLIIIKNAELSRTKSYQDTVYKCFGVPGKLLLLISICSFGFGGCIAFCVIIGDTIPHVLKAFLPESITSLDSYTGWLFRRNSIIVLCTCCISYPLCLNRNISRLAKASGFALLGMLIIVSLAVVRGALVEKSLKGDLSRSEWTFNPKVFQGISVISFAMVCHHNIIFIYNSMKDRSVKKFSFLTHVVTTFSMICCFVMGFGGLLTFGDKTKGNVLNNFKSDDQWINVARFFFGANMLTTLPLEVFVVRDLVKDIILFIFSRKKSDHELSTLNHFMLTTFLLFTSMFVSLFTCNLGMIFELIGAISASLMAYILPPSCFLKLSYEATTYRKWSDVSRHFLIYKVLPSVSCIIFGALIMVIGSYTTIVNYSQSDGSEHCVEN